MFGRYQRSPILIPAVVGLMLGAAGAAHAHEYAVTLDSDLEHLTVEACPDAGITDGPGAGTLRAGSRDAARFVEGPLQVRDGAAPARLEGRTIRLDRFSPGDCVSYRVDLARMTGSGDYRDGFRVGASVMTNPNLWLLLPYRDVRPVVITFRHPEEHAISAPWTLTAREPGETIYRIDDLQRDWPARVAMGRLSIHPVELPGTTLRVALLDGEPALNRDQTLRWIRSTAGAVASLYGEFPLPSPQVTVTPIGPRDEPVPWGHVLRGGGTAAHFYVDSVRPATEFEDDWTATHEFSHMLLPYVSRRDAWLSEGIASYYQNVLRARAGLLTPEQAWERMLAGMDRGIRNTRDRNSLAETSRRMSENGSYRRVYWSGAAYALEVDVALRRATDGRESLATALAGLRECCLPADRAWRAREVVERLDRITGTDVFSDVYQRYMPMRGFPDLGEVYARLGVIESRSGLRLNSDAPDAHIGRSIMTRRDSATAH